MCEGEGRGPNNIRYNYTHTHTVTHTHTHTQSHTHTHTQRHESEADVCTVRYIFILQRHSDKINSVETAPSKPFSERNPNKDMIAGYTHSVQLEHVAGTESKRLGSVRMCCQKTRFSSNVLPEQSLNDSV